MLQFNSDDKVKYTGRRFARELHGLTGRVVSRVHRSDRGYITEWMIPNKEGFRIESYVMDMSNLEKHTPSLKEENQLEAEMSVSLLKSKLEAGEQPAKKSRRRMVNVK